jgi:hypothetical protein
MTDHRPGGEFLLFAGDTLIGRSELEWEEAGDAVWLRSGLFKPVDAYFQFQDLFQRHTRGLGASRAQHHYDRTALEVLAGQIEKLHLRLLHPDGTEIPVAAFEVQDCADTLSEDPRGLQVEIRDRLIHDKYFSQPVA